MDTLGNILLMVTGYCIISVLINNIKNTVDFFKEKMNEENSNN